MKDFIQRLPMDIILQIIPYTYNLQNKDLLDDIVHYKETRTLLFTLYRKYWIIDGQQIEPEDKYWLINDIIAYANNYKATMYGYIDKFYNIFKRNISLQTKTIDSIDKYVNKLLSEKNINTQINIFLGLLNIHERNEIVIAFYCKQ